MQIKTSFVLASAVAAVIASSASAGIIAAWTIETAVAAGTVGSHFEYGMAESGEQTAGSMLLGHHSLATSVWSSPSGNGSARSLSSNGWSTGDYYQVAVSTTGYNDISISWDQTRSSTGPSSFEVFASNDGGSVWTSLGAYTVTQAGAAGSGTTSWNATTNQPGFFTETRSVGGAADTSTVLFQFRSLVTSSSAGSNRIDNIVISGNAVPAPGAFALLGVAGLLARRRRR